jgi:hypothetical protein
MNHIKNDNFELLYKALPLRDISISHEIYRGELYCELFKNFTKSCLDNLGEVVFSHKKNYIRTITNMLAGWFFTLYQSYDFVDDPFFPNNFMEHDYILIRTLKDYSSIHNIDEVDDKINYIINDLHYNYTLLISKLSYINNYNKSISISKKKVVQERYGETIYFYNFNINESIILCNKLLNIVNNIMIPIQEYDKLMNNYIGEKDNIDIIIWIILFRYQILSSNNNQLSVLPYIYNRMENDFNLTVECFASAINSSCKYFCSLYYDVEYYFGSIGNFFNIVPVKGVYSFNPPYQHDVITNGIKKIITHMDNSNDSLTFIITIPIWDNIGKKYMKDNFVENNNNIINYDDFEIMNDVRNSKYFRGLRMISKNDFTYMDHNFHLYKNKTIQNTYIIVMSNKENNFIDIINNYVFNENHYKDT